MAVNGWVGVAPGTTTLFIPYPQTTELRDVGLIRDDWWRTGRTTGMRGLSGPNLGLIRNDWWRTGRVSSLWGSGPITGLNGLGIIPQYHNVNRTISGGGLGTVPNDFDLGRQYGWYTPVHSGWIYGDSLTGDGGESILKEKAARETYGILRPGYREGLQGPLGATTDDVLAQMVTNQRRQLIFQAVTTLSMLTLASITIYKTLKGWR